MWGQGESRTGTGGGGGLVIALHNYNSKLNLCNSVLSPLLSIFYFIKIYEYGAYITMTIFVKKRPKRFLLVTI